ncbi:lipoprotein [Mesoplasma whartonense]|uniref:lipoprotein n=1 Tax=Mesoplasma whartonense TaxID=2878854 RepID=UPI002022B1EB|nr:MULTISPECIES: lipoprotein [unclassified Mesoplasma]MCL8213065.1 Chromosome partition protein Smc [Mesoplasma sp. JKS002661]MCL8216326.1 Chromosome partition protein Smc [Mesoplasma sp. JKS002657]
MMKNLLAILSAIGLTVVASTSIVACTTKTDDGKSDIASQLAAALKDNKVLTDRVDSLLAQVTDYQTTIDRLNNQITVLQNQLSVVNATISANKVTITKLTNDNQVLQDKVASLNSELSDASANKATLEQQINTANQTISDNQNIINDLTRKNESLTNQVKDLTNDKTSLQSQLNQANQTITDLNSQLSITNATIAANQKTITDLNAQLNEYLGSEKWYLDSSDSTNRTITRKMKNGNTWVIEQWVIRKANYPYAYTDYYVNGVKLGLSPAANPNNSSSSALWKSLGFSIVRGSDGQVFFRSLS